MSNKTEKWKPMFDGQYEISSHGRVRRGDFSHCTYRGRMMRLYAEKHGYLIVSITAYGKKMKYRVHTLVAWAFIGPRPHSKEVNHKDCNKANNCVENLEYLSRFDNIRHAVANGLVPHGEKSSAAKLTECQVAEIRALALNGITHIRSIAKHYGVVHSTIDKIIRGINWRHILPAPLGTPLPEIDMPIKRRRKEKP